MNVPRTKERTSYIKLLNTCFSLVRLRMAIPLLQTSHILIFTSRVKAASDPDITVEKPVSHLRGITHHVRNPRYLCDLLTIHIPTVSEKHDSKIRMKILSRCPRIRLLYNPYYLL